jgi:glutaredoxin 3
MAKVIIYTRIACPYCVSALRLLKQKNADFTEIDAGFNRELKNEMIEKSGRTTFPQIFIGDKHIGGCDDLYALDAQNGLDILLAK